MARVSARSVETCSTAEATTSVAPAPTAVKVACASTTVPSLAGEPPSSVCTTRRAPSSATPYVAPVLSVVTLPST